MTDSSSSKQTDNSLTAIIASMQQGVSAINNLAQTFSSIFPSS